MMNKLPDDISDLAARVASLLLCIAMEVELLPCHSDRPIYFLIQLKSLL